MEMKKVHKIVAVMIFIFASIIYLMTMAPTMSFWDCGEFIACSYRMAVPHPPGAPLFLLVGRLFTLLPIGHDIAFRTNLISVFSSSLTIMFLYLIIVHLIREWKGELKEKSDWLLAIFSGIIGSLTFAFTHSFWFNSAESEVYAASMLFTSLIVWLIMVWSSKSEEPGNERYLLMISYMIGLAIGVHLLNILAIPFVALIYYFKKYDYNIKTFLIMTGITMVIMLAIYPGMVKMVPKLALNIGAAGLVIFFIAILWMSVWAIKNKKTVYALIFTSVLLIAIGYSTYATIYIRSNLNPRIDENNPENVENFIKYIDREQYGEHSITDRYDVWKTSPKGRYYHSTLDFFWNYQVKKMYIRYFLWQFVGLDQDETNVNFYQFFALPLLLGLLGLYWQARRDPKRALAVFALFFMTGLAIILYLNQPDPQPRERDYSYVGSFFAFSIWVGLGFAGIMEMLKDAVFKNTKELKPIVGYVVFLALLLIVPVNMLARNFHTHNRTGNYVAWDYSYNMLQSCEPNGILFTNGDNDTFPLWYLQEVENVRKDVRIVNLSLLNTDWYIRQLRDEEPRVPMRMSDVDIDHVGVRRWKTQKVSVEVPKTYSEKELAEFNKDFGAKTLSVPDKIEFTVKPAINSRYGGLLRTQDMMILNIITANHWKRPVYFAVTVPKSNLLSGLSNYLRQDGLVYKLVPYKNWGFSPDRLRKNLLSVYRYRNLANPNVYFNANIKSLLQNYRSGFLRLTEFYLKNNRKDQAKYILSEMDKKISPSVIPITYPLRAWIAGLRISVDSTYVDTVLADDSEDRYLPFIGKNLLFYHNAKQAAKLLEKAYELSPADPRTLGLLLNAYEMNGNDKKAAESLEQWLRIRPNDPNAKKMLASIKKRMAEKAAKH